MEVIIHFEKEITVTAIEDDSQLTILDAVDLRDCRMTVPDLLVVALASELFTHLPVIREGADIDSATRTTGCAKHILMTERQPHGSVSAHAQPCDGTTGTVFHCRIFGIDILD